MKVDFEEKYLFSIMSHNTALGETNNSPGNLCEPAKQT